MLYTIRLQDMEFRAYHGCYDLEQMVGNRFNVGLVITAHLGEVAEQDAVELAVNYLTVYDVDHVEVLKDASIYGVRGTNGAIVVYTKK